MKLDVGMYVRTEKGKIDKIIGFDGALILFLYDFVYGYIDENDIIKASNNIIDLIEVGDYVDGYKVTDVYKPDGNEVFRIEIERNTLKGHIIDKSSRIKSIVTKEQFKDSEYVVE